MRYSLALIAVLLVLTGCSAGDVKTRSQIIGTWSQGSHTLTIASDGTFTSIFPAAQNKPETAYFGNWRVKWGRLMFSDIRSNSVAILEVGSFQIARLDDHGLDLGGDSRTVSLTR